MTVGEFIIFMAVVAVVGAYLYRITRVANALAEYRADMQRQAELDNELFLEVSAYVRDVVLPELTWHSTLHRPDDERSEAGKKLVNALARRCAHEVGWNPLDDDREAA